MDNDHGTQELKRILTPIEKMGVENYNALYDEVVKQTKNLHSKKAMENAANSTRFNLGKENNWIKTYLIVALINGLFFGILIGAALYKIIFL